MAYTRLLRTYYRREAPIPAAEVYRLVRASSKAQKAAVDAVLSEFFKMNDGAWHNKRAGEEIDAYLSKSNANRENGKLGGRPKPRDNPLGNPNGSQDEPINNLSHKPLAISQEKKKSARGRATPLPGSFEISERVKTWAEQKGFSQLPAYLEFFVGRMKANGKNYTDWDEAFMNCIREDWPEFRKRGNGHDEPVKGCAKCGDSLAGGWTGSSEGRLCNPCWSAR